MVQSDSATVFASSDERSNRFLKIKRIYFIWAQIIVLKVMQQFCVCAPTRTKGFDCKGAEARLAKMGEEQCREYGFADAGVGAGDEDYFVHASASLAAAVETDEINELTNQLADGVVQGEGCERIA
jgi:hypothetical protein